MSIIETELNKVKQNIEQGFLDPFSANDLTDFLLNGSKMIRSKITILYLKALGLDFSEGIYDILSAGEIIHNSSLLHDDVIDMQSQRRGKLTISAKYTPKMSILAGDYLISYAIDKLLRVNNSKITKIFQDCINKMTKAEIKQFFLRGQIPTKEDYIEICKGKTASLFVAIMKSCLIISNKDDESAINFADKFGIYFQIKNDLKTDSAKTDMQNEIYTATNILGIENTKILLDNYKKEMSILLENIADNTFKEHLEDIINSL